jgi:hypothetical protein
MGTKCSIGFCIILMLFVGCVTHYTTYFTSTGGRPNSPAYYIPVIENDFNGLDFSFGLYSDGAIPKSSSNAEMVYAACLSAQRRSGSKEPIPQLRCNQIKLHLVELDSTLILSAKKVGILGDSLWGAYFGSVSLPTRVDSVNIELDVEIGDGPSTHHLIREIRLHRVVKRETGPAFD